MLALGRCGKAAEAEKLAGELRAQAGKDRRVLFQAACGLAVAAGGASDPAVAKRCRDEAVRVLGDLVANGWKDRFALENDPDLETVRGEKEFAGLLARVPPGPKP